MPRPLDHCRDADSRANRHRHSGKAGPGTGAFFGGVAGLLFGVVSVFLMMMISTAVTGIDAGNGGVLCCFTIPIGTIIGVGIGYRIGTPVDPFDESDERETQKPDRICRACGYSLRGHDDSEDTIRCPECGLEIAPRAEKSSSGPGPRADTTRWDETS